MAKSKEHLERIYTQARKDFDKAWGLCQYERKQCREDRRFYSIAGAQWEGDLGAKFTNKPRLEFNKTHLGVIRIINEYRNNRIDVEFASKDGEDRDELSETVADLYRADEQDSSSEEAYDNAFEEAVGGGFGAFRLCADYEDEDDDEDERKRITFQPIFDADMCVFFDLDAKKQDKSDATQCWVLTAMSRDAFEDEWPEEDVASWPKPLTYTFDFYAADLIYVAEYYRVVKKKVTVNYFLGPMQSEEHYTDEELKDEDLQHSLESRGFTLARQKKIKKTQVEKYLISGGGVLEDCGVIPGKHIPIVPVYGKRWYVDGIERCMGHVRLAKDAQRLKNVQVSKLAEIAAYSSIEKPIFVREQVSGLESFWQTDAENNYPYMVINPVIDPASGQNQPAGPVDYTRSPNIPPALAALLQTTEQDIRDLQGNQDQGEELQSNLSGKAIELVQTRLDMQSYIYISNMSKAIRRSGEIWLSMARELYVEDGRKMKGVNEQGMVSSVELNRPIQSDDGLMGYENDLSEADFDLRVSVGPSSQSKRQGVVRSLVGLMQYVQDPTTLQVLTNYIVNNLEGEGLGELRDYFRMRLVRGGVLKPSDEEAQQLAQEAQNQQPDAQTLYLQSAAQSEQAKAVKAQADTVLTAAKAEQTKAETAQTLSNMSIEQQSHVIDVVERLNKPPESQDVATNRNSP